MYQLTMIHENQPRINGVNTFGAASKIRQEIIEKSDDNLIFAT